MSALHFSAQQQAKLAQHLTNMGYSAQTGKQAASTVAESGAFDAMTSKPASISALFSALKGHITPAQKTSSAAYEGELANIGA